MPFWIITAFAVLCFLMSLLPFIPLPFGVFRIFDFPRVQIALMSSVFLGLSLLFLPHTLPSLLPIGMLVASIAIQLGHIARFSPVWRRRSADYRGKRSQTPIVRLLISNVKQSNRDYEKIVEVVKEKQPDIAVFMETDQSWVDALNAELTDYQFRVECPLDNAYGLVVMSRFRLVDEQVRYLLNKEVPSIDTMVEHPEGGLFRLFVLHPEPPIPTDDTMGRDAEIAFVAKLVRYDLQPVIVTGDLNDVAWSRTTRRFLRVSGLLDPREGRGQFNTFDARYFFLRWPLDHIFHSPHFQLVSMARMPFVSSDHFPMFYELALTDQTVGRRETDAATHEDLEEAKELITIEKDRDRRPAGHDWEVE